jgi:major vault protein
VKIDETIQATIIKPNQALKIQALKSFKDRFNKFRQGTSRVYQSDFCTCKIVGEEWLIYETGAFLPEVGKERVIETVQGRVLTEKIGLHLKASNNFKDISGIERRAGDRWLVTSKDRELHIPDVHEIVEQVVELITVPKNHWYTRRYFSSKRVLTFFRCVIGNPSENGVIKVGESKLMKGEASFFLQPGEFVEIVKFY